MSTMAVEQDAVKHDAESIECNDKTVKEVFHIILCKKIATKIIFRSYGFKNKSLFMLFDGYHSYPGSLL
jgi:hypothetical protein